MYDKRDVLVYLTEVPICFPVETLSLCDVGTNVVPNLPQIIGVKQIVIISDLLRVPDVTEACN